MYVASFILSSESTLLWLLLLLETANIYSMFLYAKSGICYTTDFLEQFYQSSTIIIIHILKIKEKGMNNLLHVTHIN